MTRHADARAWPLLPLLVFLALFLGSGIYHSQLGTDFAFYQLKAPVAALVALVVALCLGRESLNKKLDTFIAGVGDNTIVLMCLVFLLAGAFAAVTKAIGGVDATVNAGLSILPEQLVLPGLFVVAAFLATAMGTSMGTIGALAPIAVGFAQATGLDMPLTMGAVIGGAMFGDNLSIISDTTIAATRSQNVGMRDKFLMNLRIALPAAIATLLLLAWLGNSADASEPREVGNWLLVLPYIAVLALAVSGLNVILVLLAGILFSGACGLLLTPEYGVLKLGNDIYAGFEGMLEIMLLSMLIGGLSALMKSQGGLQWLNNSISRITQAIAVGQRRAGEIAIALLVSIANLFVANNTVAIILSGEVAKNIADAEDVDPKRSASLLDIFSCVVQGVIPWGAQILLAGSLAGLSPLALVSSVYYCWLLALAALVSIILGRPRD